MHQRDYIFILITSQAQPRRHAPPYITHAGGAQISAIFVDFDLSLAGAPASQAEAGAPSSAPALRREPLSTRSPQTRVSEWSKAPHSRGSGIHLGIRDHPGNGRGSSRTPSPSPGIFIFAAVSTLERRGSVQDSLAEARADSF